MRLPTPNSTEYLIMGWDTKILPTKVTSTLISRETSKDKVIPDGEKNWLTLVGIPLICLASLCLIVWGTYFFLCWYCKDRSPRMAHIPYQRNESVVTLPRYSAFGQAIDPITLQHIYPPQSVAFGDLAADLRRNGNVTASSNRGVFFFRHGSSFAYQYDQYISAIFSYCPFEHEYITPAIFPYYPFEREQIDSAPLRTVPSNRIT